MKSLLLLLALLTLFSCSGAEDRKSSYLEKGDKLFEQGNYEKAQLEYKNALQIDPKDANAHFKLAKTSENLKNWRPALQHYLAVLQLDENHVEARVKLAQIYLLGGLRDKAQEMVNEALSLDSENVDAISVRGGIALQNDNVDLARQDADSALTLAPDNNLARSLQVAIFMRTNEIEKAIDLVNKNIEEDPGNVTQKLLLADIYIKNNQIEKALLPINSLVEQHPDKLIYRTQKVNILMRLNRIDEAEEVIKQGIDKDPENSELKILLVKFIAQHRSQELAEKQLTEFANSNPDDLKLKLALGDWHVLRNEINLAKEQYSIIIEDEESLESLDARKRLARLDFKVNQEESALQHIDKILERNPRDPDGLVLRGAHAISKQDPTGAIADFRSILKDKPNDINVLRLLAYAYLLNNQPNLAKESIQQAVKYDADNEELQLIYAKLLGSQGERETARDVLNELISNKEGNTQALKVLFDMQVAERDLDGAITTAEKMLSAHPESALPEYMMGLLFDAKGSSPEAEEKYLAALEKEPNAVEPLTALVKHYVNFKDYDKAHLLLDKTIANNANNVVAFNLKAETYVQEGNIKKAKENFNKAIDLQPAWWIPYRGLAALHLSNKKDSEALDIFALGINNGADIERLGVDRALLFEKNNKYGDAKQQYEEILSKKSDSKVASNNLAMLLVSHFSDDEFEKAGELVEEFSTSNDPAYLDTYGWVQYKLGNHDTAIPALEKAVSLAPKSSELRYHLGMAYADSNQNDKAIDELKAAVDSGQKFRGIEQAKSKLSELTASG